MERHLLIRAVTKCAARVVVLLAPSGFGKSTVARQIAQRFPEHGTCDCAGIGSVRQFAIELLAAFKDIEPFRAPMLAQNGIALARDNDDGEDLFALALHTMERISVRSLLIVDNVEQLEGPQLANALEELLRIKNPKCMVLLCSRPPAPVDFARVVPPNELLTIGTHQLRFADDEIRQILGYYSVSNATIAKVAQHTMRWPSALALAESMLRSERLSEVLPRLSASLRDRHEQIIDGIVTGLEPHLLDVLLAVVGLRHANFEDIERVGAGPAARVLCELEEHLPFLVRDDSRDVVEAHPWLVHLLLPRYASRLKAIARKVAESYERSANPVAAARAYLAAGERGSIAACLERAPLQAFTTPPAMEMIVDLGARVLSEHPLLWCASIPYRRFAIAPRILLAEARELFAGLSGLPEELRPGIVFLYALLALDAGEREHLETARRWLREHAPESVDARAVELIYDGALFGRFDESLYDAVLTQRPSEAFQGLLAGWHTTCLMLKDRLPAALEALDDAVNAAQRSQGVLRASQIRSQMHFLAWLQGDDARAERTIEEVEKNLLPYQQHAFRAYTTAIRERRIFGLPDTMTAHWRAVAALCVAGYTKNPERALEAAHFALEQADASLETFTHVLARIALALLGDEAADAHLQRAAELARQLDSPLLHADVESLTRGRNDDVRLLGAFVRRFERHASATIVVDIFSQRAWRGTREIRLSDRVRELLFTLALNEGSMRTSDLQTLLWPTLSLDKSSNALKAAVHRLRSQIGEGGIIQPSGNGYWLNAQVTIDEGELRAVLSRVARTQRVDDEAAGRLSAVAALLSDRVMHRHRRRYAQMQRGVAYALGLHTLETGKFRLARKYATMMLEIDPYDERAYGLVITALTRSGDLASASGVYAAYRNTMAEAGLECNAALEYLLIPPVRSA